MMARGIWFGATMSQHSDTRKGLNFWDHNWYRGLRPTSDWALMLFKPYGGRVCGNILEPWLLAVVVAGKASAMLVGFSTAAPRSKNLRIFLRFWEHHQYRCLRSI